MPSYRPNGTASHARALMGGGGGVGAPGRHFFTFADDRIKFFLDDAPQLGIMEDVHDVVHARPKRKDSQGRTVPARFDTVLVNEGMGGPTGVHGTVAAKNNGTRSTGA